MKIWICLMVYLCHLTLYANDAEEFEKKTGLKGSYNEAEKVFKISFPRTDVKVSINGSLLDPFMGLTSWAAFTPASNGHFLVMGDLVLFEDEVNPVMSSLFENNIHVTALHNHFFFDQPKVYFMHIAGSNSIESLANGVKKAMDTVKKVRSIFPNINSEFKNTFTINSEKHSISSKQLEDIFGIQGQEKNGMVKFVFGRKVTMNGIELGKEMGVSTWAAFRGSNDHALVDGDFAITEDELQQVLKILRKGHISIVAIHNHMTMENPRIIFLHFFGMGHAEELAKTINEALQATKTNDSGKLQSIKPQNGAFFKPFQVSEPEERSGD